MYSAGTAVRMRYSHALWPPTGCCRIADGAMLRVPPLYISSCCQVVPVSIHNKGYITKIIYSTLDSWISNVAPAISPSPMAHRLAEKTSRRELMQKKLIVCPISSHEPARRLELLVSEAGIACIPVSVTLKKNVMVITEADHECSLLRAVNMSNIPSVNVSAMRNRLNGGR